MRAIYSALAEAGFFDVKLLLEHYKTGVTWTFPTKEFLESKFQWFSWTWFINRKWNGV